MFEYVAFSPLIACAVTAMTLLQFAGALIPVTLPSLPAAATTTEPAPTAASIALCSVCAACDARFASRADSE